MTLLGLLAILLIIAGVITLVRCGILFGILLIVAGLIVGPGGIVLTR